MKKLLLVALVVVALLPVVGYWFARVRGIARIAPADRAALRAPLDALHAQSRALEGAVPDTATACALNGRGLRARVSCDRYVERIRSRLAPFVGATLDVTSMAGHPMRDAMLVLTVAAVGPHGSGEFSVRMVREGEQWRIADVMRYGRSVFD